MVVRMRLEMKASRASGDGMAIDMADVSTLQLGTKLKKDGWLIRPAR